MITTIILNDHAWQTPGPRGHRIRLIFFKLYASADQTTPDNVHVRDLLALLPADEELDAAASWVREQDPSADFHAVLDKVVAHVRATLRPAR